MAKSPPTNKEDCSIGWTEGSGGILAGVLAAACCGLPPILGVLGLTGLAGAVSSMSFTYHLIFQWVALGLILVTWGWFGWKWMRMDREDHRAPWTVISGVILLLVTLYVVKTWFAHVFLMG